MNEMRKKILIADDEPSIVLLLSGILAREYAVLVASDGEQAVDIARHEKPDLVLLDIMMPNVDGYSACHAIKTEKVTRAISVVMLTALSHELNRKLAQDIGADGYITKPFSVRRLLHTIDQFLERSE